MKRLPILLLALGLLSAGLLAGTGIAVHRTGDQVALQAETLAGDPSAAQGLEVEMPFTCGYELMWDTSFLADRPAETETALTFSPFGFSWSPRTYGDRTIPFSVLPPTYSFSGDGLSPTDGWYEAVQLVAGRTPDGQEHTEVIHPADLYDSWPLELYAYTLSHRSPPQVELFGHTFSTDYLLELYQSYFSTPIPEDYYATVTVRKDPSGLVEEVEWQWDHHYSLRWDSYEADIGDALLFSVFAYYEDWNTDDQIVPADDSRIPGGWGVYRLSLDEAGTGCRLDTVYSLPEGSIIQQFWASTDGSALFLLTKEEDTLRLRIFDRDMVLQDTVDLMPLGPDERFLEVWQEDGYFVAVVYAGDFCRLAVMAQDGQDWELLFTSDAPDRVLSSITYGSYGRDVLDTALSDGRLAICGILPDTSSAFYLAVYDEGELAYLGKYTNSLAPGGRDAGLMGYDSIHHPGGSWRGQECKLQWQADPKGGLPS